MWSVFEPIAEGDGAEHPTGTVDFEGRSRHENARDGLRLLEATAHNATSRSSLWSGTSRIQIETPTEWAGKPATTPAAATSSTSTSRGKGSEARTHRA
jgi:hypothetical protein